MRALVVPVTDEFDDYFLVIDLGLWSLRAKTFRERVMLGGIILLRDQTIDVVRFTDDACWLYDNRIPIIKPNTEDDEEYLDEPMEVNIPDEALRAFEPVEAHCYINFAPLVGVYWSACTDGGGVLESESFPIERVCPPPFDRLTYKGAT